MIANGILIAASALMTAAAASATEKVGRLEFELPSAAWKLVAEKEHGLRYQSGKEIPLFTKLYALPGSGSVPRAMLVVTSTDGSSQGRTLWVTERCPDPRPNYFTADFDSNKVTRVRECIVVNPDFVAAKFFLASDPLLIAFRGTGATLPAAAYSLRTTVGNDGGAYVSVNLIAAKDFAGVRRGAPAASDMYGVAPELVTWGEALHSAVKESTRLGGRLELPSIEFKEP